MKSKYLIFGENVLLNTIDSMEGNLLHQELSVYPSGEARLCTIEINYLSELPSRPAISKNPSTHVLVKDGFIIDIGVITISYHFQDHKIVKIDFVIKHTAGFYSALRKLMNIQFTSHKEAIGQWFHEHIIVPLGFFSKEIALVHSSAVSTSKNSAILFGGTVGVVKTSLEIELCRNHECAFITDDISVVSKKGSIHPNLAYPKIYRDNIKGNPEIKKEIFEGRGIWDKLFFKLHSLRGDQKVRRRVSAEKFYGKVKKSEEKIDSYFLLVKRNVEQVQIEPIDIEQAINLTQQVIFREYSGFIDHIVWHEYNAALANVDGQITKSDIEENSTEVLRSAFHEVKKLYVINIPLVIDHADFKREVVLLLKNQNTI